MQSISYPRIGALSTARQTGCRPAVGPAGFARQLRSSWHAGSGSNCARLPPSAALDGDSDASSSSSGGAATSVRELPSLMVEGFSTLQDPSRHQVTYTNALEAFVHSAILAYECGHSEQTVMDNLRVAYLVRNMGEECAFEETLCWRFISLVWVTLMLSPSSVKRWSSGPAVTDSTAKYWRGFVGMLLSAYFNKRMSWFPIDRLMLERNFTTGARQKPELVAESARIVFTTLDIVAPQFPKM